MFCIEIDYVDDPLWRIFCGWFYLPAEMISESCSKSIEWTTHVVTKVLWVKKPIETLALENHGKLRGQFYIYVPWEKEWATITYDLLATFFFKSPYIQQFTKKGGRMAPLYVCFVSEMSIFFFEVADTSSLCVLVLLKYFWTLTNYMPKYDHFSNNQGTNYFLRK